MRTPRLSPAEKALRIPFADLDDAIIDAVGSGLTSVSDIVKLLNHSRSSVAKRLERMERELITTRQRSAVLHGSPDKWYINPDFTAGKIARYVKPVIVETPRQATVKVYPIICGRDYLVAALFGAPQASQAQGAV
jgi:hypothetical protein